MEIDQKKEIINEKSTSSFYFSSKINEEMKNTFLAKLQKNQKNCINCKTKIFQLYSCLAENKIDYEKYFNELEEIIMFHYEFCDRIFHEICLYPGCGLKFQTTSSKNKHQKKHNKKDFPQTDSDFSLNIQKRKIKISKLLSPNKKSKREKKKKEEKNSKTNPNLVTLELLRKLPKNKVFQISLESNGSYEEKEARSLLFYSPEQYKEVAFKIWSEIENEIILNHRKGHNYFWFKVATALDETYGNTIQTKKTKFEGHECSQRELFKCFYFPNGVYSKKRHRIFQKILSSNFQNETFPWDNTNTPEYFDVSSKEIAFEIYFKVVGFVLKGKKIVKNEIDEIELLSNFTLLYFEKMLDEVTELIYRGYDDDNDRSAFFFFLSQCGLKTDGINSLIHSHSKLALYYIKYLKVRNTNDEYVLNCLRENSKEINPILFTKLKNNGNSTLFTNFLNKSFPNVHFPRAQEINILKKKISGNQLGSTNRLYLQGNDRFIFSKNQIVNLWEEMKRIGKQNHYQRTLSVFKKKKTKKNKTQLENSTFYFQKPNVIIDYLQNCVDQEALIIDPKDKDVSQLIIPFDIACWLDESNVQGALFQMRLYFPLKDSEYIFWNVKDDKKRTMVRKTFKVIVGHAIEHAHNYRQLSKVVTEFLSILTIPFYLKLANESLVKSFFRLSICLADLKCFGFLYGNAGCSSPFPWYDFYFIFYI